MLGERLKSLRKIHKVKQEQLSAVVKVKKSTISLYETNKSNPSDDVKVEIAKYFDVSLDYLMGLVDIPIQCFDEKLFLKLPNSVTPEERALIADFVDFVVARRKEQ